MKSTKEHPQVIDEYITKECTAGRLLAPLDPQIIPEIHMSRFGVIHTKDGTRQLRVDSGPICNHPQRLGIPMAEQKLVGPTGSLTLVGPCHISWH